MSSSKGEDARFSAMHTSATFKKNRKEDRKIKLDNRFESVLTEDRFRVAPGQVDKYGRKAKKGGKNASIDAATKELEGFYEIEKKDEGEEDKKEEKGEKEDKRKSKVVKNSMDKMSMEERLEYINKLSRGEISDSGSDSSSDSSDSDSSGESDSDSDASSALGDEEHKSAKTKKSKKSSRSALQPVEPASMAAGEAGEEAGEEVPTGGDEVATKRIALQNCDWDSLRAEDLLVAIQSFCPTGGSVKRVTIYPSDFGLREMEKEEKYGPQGIFSRSKKDSDSDKEEDEEEEEGVYDHVKGDLDDEESESEEEEAEEEDDEKEEGDKKSKAQKAKKAKKDAKAGDFKRKIKGGEKAVGVVLQTELVRRGKADKTTLEEDEATAATAGSGASEGMDLVALREYELAKLQYYFAIAEFDSVETAASLYDQLDGVELEHSSMVFDLRFVPDEVDISVRTLEDGSSLDRRPKDVFNASSAGPSSNYRPPDFIVNALQHTDVKCTWDDDDKAGEWGKKMGSTLTKWRDLEESDMHQFLASDSDEEEADKSKGGKGSGKKGKKGKNDMRKMLLGAEADSDDDDDSNEEMPEDDDFFVHPDSDEDDAEEGDDDDEGEDDGDKTYSYVPEVSKSALARKKEERAKEAEETPFEKQQRLYAEKKRMRRKERKAAAKGDKGKGGDVGSKEAEKEGDDMYIDNFFAGDKGDKEKGPKGAKAKKAKAKDDKDKAVKAAGEEELRLMFDEEAGDRAYDMREIRNAAKEKGKKGKKSKKKATEEESAEQENAKKDAFKVDLEDSRFSSLMQGDSRFGIDPMATEFKETPAMRDILTTQSKHRHKEEKKRKKSAETNPSDVVEDSGNGAASTVDIERMKAKFAKQAKQANSKKQKQKR